MRLLEQGPNETFVGQPGGVPGIRGSGELGDLGCLGMYSDEAPWHNRQILGRSGRLPAWVRPPRSLRTKIAHTGKCT